MSHWACHSSSVSCSSRPHAAGAGVVDQHVEVAEVLEAGRDDALARVGRGHVERRASGRGARDQRLGGGAQARARGDRAATGWRPRRSAGEPPRARSRASRRSDAGAIVEAEVHGPRFSQPRSSTRFVGGSAGNPIRGAALRDLEVLTNVEQAKIRRSATQGGGIPDYAAVKSAAPTGASLADHNYTRGIPDASFHRKRVIAASADRSAGRGRRCVCVLHVDRERHRFGHRRRATNWTVARPPRRAAVRCIRTSRRTDQIRRDLTRSRTTAAAART